MKIINIVGARPQFIKYFPISKAIANAGTKIKDILVHTGQHYDYAMSELFFNELGIKVPDYHLGVGSGTHGWQTAQMIEGIEELLQRERPEAVVIYGDTNSTLAGAITSVKLHIPVVHVEAGLRSYNKRMPEEINRVLSDHGSTILLCPTKNAVENLKNEGFKSIVNNSEIISLYEDLSRYKVDMSNPIVINVGDVMYDVMLAAVDVAANKSNILADMKLTGNSYGVLTIHRAENTEAPVKLKEILDFVSASTKTPVVFPVHPRTKNMLNGIEAPENIQIVEPLGYFDMLWLVKNSSIVFTDSGGLQKEAYWLKVPCITLRDETEWIETVQSGWNVLYKNYNKAHEPVRAENYYGDGKAAERIVHVLLNTISKEMR